MSSAACFIFWGFLQAITTVKRVVGEEEGGMRREEEGGPITIIKVVGLGEGNRGDITLSTITCFITHCDSS